MQDNHMDNTKTVQNRGSALFLYLKLAGSAVY